jgi:hypothetical protein
MMSTVSKSHAVQEKKTCAVVPCGLATNVLTQNHSLFWVPFPVSPPLMLPDHADPWVRMGKQSTMSETKSGSIDESMLHESMLSAGCVLDHSTAWR